MAVTVSSRESTAAAPRLSLLEKLDLIPAILTLTVTVLCAAVTGLWRGEKQARTLPLHIGYAMMRKATIRLTSNQLQ